jgi:hypothetical protein
MNLNKTVVTVLLGVSLMPCGAFAESALGVVAEGSQGAVVSEDLGAASDLAAQSFSGLSVKKDNPTAVEAVHQETGASQAEPVKVSEPTKKPQAKAVPVLAGGAQTCPSWYTAEECKKVNESTIAYENRPLSAKISEGASLGGEAAFGILHSIGTGFMGLLSAIVGS